MLCSKLYCKTGFDLILFSCQTASIRADKITVPPNIRIASPIILILLVVSYHIFLLSHDIPCPDLRKHRRQH